MMENLWQKWCVMAGQQTVSGGLSMTSDGKSETSTHINSNQPWSIRPSIDQPLHGSPPWVASTPLAHPPMDQSLHGSPHELDWPLWPILAWIGLSMDHPMNWIDPLGPSSHESALHGSPYELDAPLWLIHPWNTRMNWINPFGWSSHGSVPRGSAPVYQHSWITPMNQFSRIDSHESASIWINSHE